MEKVINKKQLDCIKFDENRPLLIEAGPGAGKTFVLTERVKCLLERGADPESFLVITFTIKAADELKLKLSNMDIPEKDINKMQISTIHSFCLKLLEGTDKENYKIYEDEQRLLFLRKHMKELGFVNEAYASKGKAPNILKKFDEYSAFGVKTPDLVEYIKRNYPVCEDYIKFVYDEMEINQHFPQDKLKDEGYRRDWYNARYLQIAKSYPKYMELLDDDEITDFNLLQYDALEFLENNPDTKYTNVLIDEFQDTDPIQIAIFEILLENALRKGGSFTAVGDPDQSIYGFRGSIDNYFDYMCDKYEDCIEKISLECNYRSTCDIIGLGESFIENQRSDNGKHLKSARRVSKDAFYIKNSDADSQAFEISQIVKHLHDTQNLNYNDFAVLCRSVKTSSVKKLVKSLEELEIPYQIKGLNNLKDADEIKSLLTLLHYLVQDDKPSSFKRVDLKEFTDSQFNQLFVDFSDETKDALEELQDNYENCAREIEKELRKEMGDYNAIRSYNGIFNRPDNFYIQKVFEFVTAPILSDENLEEYIKNEDDLDFFKKLHALKRKVKDMPMNFEIDDEVRMEKIRQYYEHHYGMHEIPTIMDIFYELMEITGFLNLENLNDEEYDERIENIALVTQTIYNFENVVSRYDVNGLYWYLNSNVGMNEPDFKEDDCVQIMTVHGSKGLEFPVTIVYSLGETAGRGSNFPKEYQNPLNEDLIFKNEPFYTPPEFLKLKHQSIAEEEKSHKAEEQRIIYVAITRAQDILILSCLDGDEYDIPYSIRNLIEENPDLIKELDSSNMEDLPIVEKRRVIEKEKLNLSYTTISYYNKCPLRYKLTDVIGFRLSETDSSTDDIGFTDDIETASSNWKRTYGTIAHNSLDTINKLILDKCNDDSIKVKQVSVKEMDDIIDNEFKKYEEYEFTESHVSSIKEHIHKFYDDFASNVFISDSEYSFRIRQDDYDLVGSIDLIYQEDDDSLSIIDFKVTTNAEANMGKYKKQLATYKLALKMVDDDDYNDKRIDKLSIYSVLDDKTYDFSADEIDCDDILEEIESTAENILEERFDSKVSNSCKYCKFNFVCGNKS
ncbi:MAG: ATP-dependent DNA helicase [Methanobrevibacter sp.]|nr:ATP-dependent DNA helicase [Methanobrevibacter sp.]